MSASVLADTTTLTPVFTPSPHQARFFDWVAAGRGSAVLVAVAGSGKTTSIVWSLLGVPERLSVQLLAFNTTIAQELNLRLDGLRQETGRAFAKVRASTFHSLGNYAIK
jgi:superfamily I DNA/RNA helicase